MKCEVFPSSGNMQKSGISDLADRGRPKSSSQRLSQARWVVPVQVPHSLRGGGAPGLGLEGGAELD